MSSNLRPDLIRGLWARLRALGRKIPRNPLVLSPSKGAADA